MAFDPTHFDAARFAAEWAADWHRRDLDAVLSHFASGVVFSTPKAVDTVGKPTVVGVPAIRAYWAKALAPITALQFDVVRTLWDPNLRELGIIYDRAVNGRHDRALELYGFDTTGKVDRGEVFYGVIPEPS